MAFVVAETIGRQTTHSRGKNSLFKFLGILLYIYIKKKVQNCVYRGH